MNSRARQVLPYAVMLVAAVLLFWAATRIDVDTGGRIGPAVWPKTIIVILALLCAYEIVKRVVAGRTSSATGLLGGLSANPAEGEADVAEPAGPDPIVKPGMLWAGIALVAAYVVLAPRSEERRVGKECRL